MPILKSPDAFPWQSLSVLGIHIYKGSKLQNTRIEYSYAQLY